MYGETNLPGGSLITTTYGVSRKEFKVKNLYLNIDLGENRMSTYAYAKQEFEKSWIERTMQECKYNQSKAAKRLGISRGGLRIKLEKHFGNKYFRDSDD